MNEASNAEWTRRRFLKTTAAATAAGAAGAMARPLESAAATVAATSAAPPVVISSSNGLRFLEDAMKLLKSGKDPLDAVLAVVNRVEDNPKDHSVGLGGLPNEDGVVELDASVMHGPTHKAGAVGALRNIKNPSLVARKVMERTDHVLLVGEGALRFARAHGFKEEELLTDEARAIWLRWKESHSTRDDWVSPAELRGEPQARAMAEVPHTWGTINCNAVDANGNIAGVTTTSGLSYKIPGRVGDSPIIGAGLYVDNAVGAAGSTGRGEANLQNCASFLVVEMMRSGKSPEDACLEVLKRIADHTEPRLKDKKGRPTFNLKFYAVAKDGRIGGGSMWDNPGAKFAVHDGTEARIERCACLYERA